MQFIPDTGLGKVDTDDVSSPVVSDGTESGLEVSVEAVVKEASVFNADVVSVFSAVVIKVEVPIEDAVVDIASLSVVMASAMLVAVAETRLLVMSIVVVLNGVATVSEEIWITGSRASEELMIVELSGVLVDEVLDENIVVVVV
jgi:hypothetical protein